MSKNAFFRRVGVMAFLGAALLPAHAPAQIKAPLLIASPAKQLAEAPISLTGSDGSGLNLVALEANAVVEDPLAFTELRLTFSNPESRTREGRFRITLPVGATVSRFAMKVNGAWQEGEVVETQAARVAYEDFLHRRQDPALLEAEAGNEFSARVFPIPANGTKELILSYSQTLTRHDEPYVLPLRGLPQLGSLKVRALVRKQSSGGAATNLGGERAQTEVVELDKTSWQPDRDLEIAHDGNRLGLRHQNLVAARVVPLSDTGAADRVSSLFVLLDTSASRALALEDQLNQLQALLAQLGDIPVQVAAFDQTAKLVFDGRSTDLSALRKALLARRALGASDLEGALKFAAGELAKRKHARVLLVSDGVATAGETAADKLRTRIKALPGVERLDVLAATGIRDEALLSRLVSAGLARNGVVLDAARAPALLAQKLARSTRSVSLEVEGAGWVWPKTLDGVQPGDEIVVFADLAAERAFKLKVDGKPLPLQGALASVERPLLERAWVKARIDRMIEQRDGIADTDRDLADALRTQAIELSTKYRVLSPFTSLLVLETEADYARFHIERRALADILSVDAHGVSLLHRADIATAQPVLATAKGALRNGPVAEGAPVAESAANVVQPMQMAAQAEEAPREAAKKSDVASDGFGSGVAPGRGGGVPAPRPAPAASGAGGAAAPMRSAAPAPARAREEAADDRAVSRESAAPESRRMASSAVAEKKAVLAPVTGELKVVLDLLRSDKQAALQMALAWRTRDAGDVLALIALGEAFEALGQLDDAERAYGAIIDLFPGRADLRRFAGERLERIHSARALALAVDTYRKAVAQRADHPASHRLLGFALLKQGKPHDAFDALLNGVKQHYPEGRFRGVDRILREDLGLAAAAWIKAEPALAEDIAGKLTHEGGSFENTPSLRFVLNWETDANDVDFHITDGKGGHAYYSDPHLPSGGDLYADVTTGYGPECFAIRGAKRAYPYTLQAHYYSRGPMGYGMGKLEVIEHDGKGTLKFEERPFIVMQDGAFVELGTVRGGLARAE